MTEPREYQIEMGENREDEAQIVTDQDETQELRVDADDRTGDEVERSLDADAYETGEVDVAEQFRRNKRVMDHAKGRGEKKATPF